jgi:GAF domain-containing protein
VPLPDAALAELTAIASLPLLFDDLSEALDEMCRIAVRAVPNADGASFTAFGQTGPAATAASDEWAQRLDEMQYVEHEGPCLDAGRTGVLFRVRDIHADARWPSYLPRAAEHGAASLMSIPLTVEAKVIGALNLYSKAVDAFDAEAVSVAEIVAAHASLANQVAAALYEHRQLADQLRSAMASRAAIEQAKGIIMATTRCSPDDAFRRLVEQSQHENRKVREIAEELIARQTGSAG